MRQFNSEEYLKNPDRQIVTRDGRPARIICTDRNSDRYHGNYPIIALIQEDFREDVLCYTEDGLFLRGSKKPEDLFFVTEKKTGWVNIYNRAARGCGLIYESEEKARLNADKDKTYIATVKIEWEE